MVLMNLGFNFFSGFRASEGESANETTGHFINRFYRSAYWLHGTNASTSAGAPCARTPTGTLAPAPSTANRLPGSERDLH
jgi:hypothetical protein